MESIPYENIKVIWEIAFSEFVRKHYGRPYQLQQQGDCYGQNTLIRFSIPTHEQDEDTDDREVSLATWLAADPHQLPPGQHYSENIPPENWLIILCWQRDFYPGFYAILNDLHQKGILKEGEYAIHVWW